MLFPKVAHIKLDVALADVPAVKTFLALTLLAQVEQLHHLQGLVLGLTQTDDLLDPLEPLSLEHLGYVVVAEVVKFKTATGVDDVDEEVVEVEDAEDQFAKSLSDFVGLLCGHDFGDIGPNFFFDILF
jgi:hypothetical protein